MQKSHKHTAGLIITAANHVRRELPSAMNELQLQHIRIANLPLLGHSAKCQAGRRTHYLPYGSSMTSRLPPGREFCPRPFSYYYRHYSVYAANTLRRLQLASRKAAVACETITLLWGHRITRVLLQTCPTSDNLVSWSLSHCSLVHIDPDLVPVEEPHCSFVQ